ncbi:MAG: hypothetical protein BRD55_11965 [Bacteroidetes bacterium SW_9_63_38]|nr:MAG: hypothetical protein BRD55_11965 [Bacteroidetes bacterium SW_9_63_38]
MFAEAVLLGDAESTRGENPPVSVPRTVLNTAMLFSDILCGALAGGEKPTGKQERPTRNAPVSGFVPDQGRL